MAIQIRYQTLLYTGSMPRSVFMQIMHENHEFACAKINAIDFVCINCCWNKVRVNSNISSDSVETESIFYRQKKRKRI